MSQRVEVSCSRLLDGDPPAPALEALWREFEAFSRRIFVGARVLLKPNFVAPFPKATTDLAFVEFFIEAVRNRGGLPIIGESSGFEFDTRAAFEVLGVEEFARRHNVPLLNFDEGGYRAISLGRGAGSVELAEAAIHADWIINLPVIKGHSVTGMTGAVKNLFGLASRASRRRLHAHGLHRAIAAIARHFQAKTLHVADARRRLRRAVFSESEPLGYLLGSVDPFALDHLACRLLGIRPESVQHLDSCPSYGLRAQLPMTFPLPEKAAAPLDHVRRGIYAAAYAVDHCKSRLVGGRSLLPALHWHLGVHPELAPDLTRAELEQVAQSCPVGAVDLASGRIRREACRPVRCLACHRSHPSLVRLGGLNPPARLQPRGVPEGSHA